MAASKFYAIVAGVGAGTGRAAALKFSQTYPVVLLARNASNFDPIVDEITKAGGHAIGVSTDVTSQKSVEDAFATIKKEMGDKKLAAAVFNVGGRFIRKPFLELSLEEGEAGWEANGRGIFLFSQKAIPLLLDSVGKNEHPPTLILTGATASIKGSALCASFAAGKFAMRALGQSMAREFGPKGVHVAHAIIDGVIDIPRTKEWAANGGVDDGKLRADAVAEGYWQLHTQHRSAWTQELDMRPFVEKW